MSKKELYLKAIELDPSLKDPYIRLAATIGENEKVHLLNGTSCTQEDLLLKFRKSAIPVEKAMSPAPSNARSPFSFTTSSAQSAAAPIAAIQRFSFGTVPAPSNALPTSAAATSSTQSAAAPTAAIPRFTFGVPPASSYASSTAAVATSSTQPAVVPKFTFGSASTTPGNS
jgi:hypothetical protein